MVSTEDGFVPGVVSAQDVLLVCWCSVTRWISANQTRQDDDDHCSYGSGDDSVCRLAADAEINAEALQEETADEGSRQPGDHVLKETRSTHEPTCQPACCNTNPDLDGDGPLVQSRKSVAIHADADREPSAG